MFRIKHENLYKLFTYEDRYNVHKLLGVVCLTHFVVRFYNLFVYGDMLFLDSIVDYLLLFCHFLLSISSLLFAIPSNRVKSMIVIWPEFRAHSILFATRSLACILCSYAMYSIHHVRLACGIIVLFTMVAADMATQQYNLNMDKTTMRGMSWPNFFPMNNHHYQRIHNCFYSFSQIGATLSMFTGNYPDHPFMMLLPIQIAPFLSTLVKKNIISDFYWHLVYTLTLILPYLYSPSPVRIEWMVLIAFLRFYLRMDKYILWSLVLFFEISRMKQDHSDKKYLFYQ